MRIENIIIIVLVAALIYFGFMKKGKQDGTTTPTRQTDLPSQNQTAQGDGGAARALIEEGAGLLHDVIDRVFTSSSDSTAPQTASNTI